MHLPQNQLKFSNHPGAQKSSQSRVCVCVCVCVCVVRTWINI